MSPAAVAAVCGLFDAGAHNWGGFEPSDSYNADDPTTTVTGTTTTAVVAFLQARSTADLDLDVNVLPVMMEASWQVTPRLGVRFAAGSTLNVVTHRMQPNRLVC